MYKELPILPIKSAKSSIGFNTKNDLLFLTTDEPLSNNENYINLFVIGDKPIEEPTDILKQLCIFISDNNMITTLAGKGYGLVKGIGKYFPIIATTDSTLEIRYDERFSNVYVSGKSLNKKLPQIPMEFIKHYIRQFNTNNIIQTIEVKFDCDHNQMPTKIIDVLEVDSNGFISIKYPEKHIILQFVEQVQNEFKDVNLDYLTFAAEHFIQNLPK